LILRPAKLLLLAVRLAQVREAMALTKIGVRTRRIQEQTQRKREFDAVQVDLLRAALILYDLIAPVKGLATKYTVNWVLLLIR